MSYQDTGAPEGREARREDGLPGPSEPLKGMYRLQVIGLNSVVLVGDRVFQQLMWGNHSSSLHRHPAIVLWISPSC